jgi:hypothetical protein
MPNSVTVMSRIKGMHMNDLRLGSHARTKYTAARMLSLILRVS